jgi:hypothetical protein
VSTPQANILKLIISVGQKIARAIEHIQTLDAAAKRWGDEHGEPGFPCVVEPNSQGTKVLVKIDQPLPFPGVEWGIIIGDAIHCLRSALDQLVAGLWTDKTSITTRFPICKTEREWIVNAPGMYWSVPPAYVAVLDRAQPYHRGDKANEHPLAILNALWNLDKHEAIPAMALTGRRIKIEAAGADGFPDWQQLKFRTHPGRALKQGTVLGEASYRDADTEDNAKVYVNAHITVAVAFGQIDKASVISGKPVGQTFQDLLIPAVIDVAGRHQSHSRRLNPVKRLLAML